MFRLTPFLPSEHLTVILGNLTDRLSYYTGKNCSHVCFYLLELFPKTFGCQGRRRRRRGATDRQICSQSLTPTISSSVNTLPIPYLSLQLHRTLHHVKQMHCCGSLVNTKHTLEHICSHHVLYVGVRQPRPPCSLPWPGM